MQRTTRTWTALVALLALAAGARAQDVQEEADRQAPPPLLKMADLELAYYVPTQLNVDDLAEVAARMVGREIWVEERGGYGAPGVRNLAMIGDRIVVFDTPEYVARVLATLGQLDAASGTEGGRPSTETYTLRYISGNDALTALQPFRQGRHNANAISVLEGRSTLVLRAEPQALADMREVLQRIDVPAEQALVRCWFLRGERGQEDAADAPEELLSNLRTLVPGLGFETLGFTLIQTTVVPREEIQIETQGKDGFSFRIEFRPIAYDAKVGTLTVADCKVESLSQNAPPGRLFSNAVLRGGEYTVLGASGSDPVFAVIHVSPAR